MIVLALKQIMQVFLNHFQLQFVTLNGILQPQVLALASVEDGTVEDMQLQHLLAIIG